MKLRSAFLIILLIIVADQTLKIWIKTHYAIGDSTRILGQRWAQLYFIENEGMAWGWKWGGDWGKLLLTLFRLGAVIFGTWYLARIVREKYARGFITCAALIYAGALGNLIDSMFYGLIFEDSNGHVAKMFPAQGYAGFLHGHVVDMLYFPMFNFSFAGEKYQFFSPIFNIADAAISTGVIALLLFYTTRPAKQKQQAPAPTVTTDSMASDQREVM